MTNNLTKERPKRPIWVRGAVILCFLIGFGWGWWSGLFEYRWISLIFGAAYMGAVLWLDWRRTGSKQYSLGYSIFFMIAAVFAFLEFFQRPRTFEGFLGFVFLTLAVRLSLANRWSEQT